MEDLYALIGVSSNEQRTTLLIESIEVEALRIKRALDRMPDYARIELVPMRLLLPSPAQRHTAVRPHWA